MKRIVITSGYFDPIHAGHIDYLELSKELGDYLVVIINNDKQCVGKKGFFIISEKQRKRIIEAFSFVDETFISIDEDGSVCASIKEVSSWFSGDKVIFAKGGDRFANEIPEMRVCIALDVEVVDCLGEKITSSSDIIKKIVDHSGDI